MQALLRRQGVLQVLCSCPVGSDLARLACSPIQIMEYAEDLEAWASLSYGNASNTGFSYRLLEDMTSKFSDRNQEATLYFAHVEVLFPFMTLLRINEDPFSLTADTYDRKRSFRSSLMAPFAANMGFALYQCPSAVDRPVVVAFHNQVPLALPKCPGPCYLEDFKKNYLVRPFFMLLSNRPSY